MGPELPTAEEQKAIDKMIEVQIDVDKEAVHEVEVFKDGEPDIDDVTDF